MTISFSRRLAIAFGILAPLAETIRRWSQLGQLSVWPFWLDDYIMGALLLYGAWRSGKDLRGGRRFLVAAWGFTCGMGYASFFNQLIFLNEPDPAPISSGWVATIKGVGLTLSIIALIVSLNASPESKAEEAASQSNSVGKSA